MKEIKRYTIQSYTDLSQVDDNGKYILYADYKAVVEVKDKKYLSLKCCANKQYLTIETMQKRIDDINNIYESACLELKNCIGIKNKLEKENKELRTNIINSSIQNLLSLEGDDLILVRAHCKKEIEELREFLK